MPEVVVNNSRGLCNFYCPITLMAVAAVNFQFYCPNFSLLMTSAFDLISFHFRAHPPSPVKRSSTKNKIGLMRVKVS
jgi:hypothetical protein